MSSIPCPAGRRYKPFQLEGARFALARKHSINGDDPGLGKTIQSIAVMNGDRKIRKVLVLCPATLRLNWKREIRKWSMRKRRIQVIEAGVRVRSFSRYDVIIANYESMRRIRRDIDWYAWDLVVIDEAHFLKNPKADRTRYVLGGTVRKVQYNPVRGRRRLFLTGTPLRNHPIELWPMIKACDRQGLGQSYTEYALRYCGLRKGYGGGLTAKGCRNLDELREKLQGFMIRRRKRDVLKELPPKQRQVIELPRTGLDTLLKEELRIYTSHQEYVDQVMRRVASGEKAPKSAVLGELSKLRHRVALAKVPQVIEHLRESLEAGPVVCFAHHRDVLAKLYEAFRRRAVTLVGNNSLTERQRAVDRFQAGKAELFLGNIEAAGTGITLTASSQVVFAELSWVPGDLTQCEDRLDRIGQRNSVLVQHLVLEGSLDAIMVRTLVRKQKIIDRVT